MNIVPGVCLSVCLKEAGQADKRTGSKTGRHTDIEKGWLAGWLRATERERGQMDIWTVRQREKQTISTYGLTERRIQEETDRDIINISVYV